MKGEEIVSTPGHKYYLPEAKEWTEAKNLKIGMKVLLSSGECGIIEATRSIHYDKPKTTYNFEVADFHTYYVGIGVLVHNLGCGGDGDFGNLRDGMEMTPDEALDAAQDFLGPDYAELPAGNGKSRFVSNQGMGNRQVRMNTADILGQHGPGPHINFDILRPRFKTIHIRLK